MNRTSPEDRNRWRVLVLLSVAVSLGMSQWFAASAISPHFRDLWGLSATATGWLTTSVQLGFVAGTAVAAILNFADIVPARWYFAVSAVLASVANAALLDVSTYESAIALRFLTGFFLAGVYPPAMKMVATWFRTGRGLAIGFVVGALTVGKALPFLFKAFGGPGVAPVLIGASVAGGVGAGLVVIGYRDGPFAFDRRPFSFRLVADVFRHRDTMLATGGYLGHMWELYGMWTLIALFLTDVFIASGQSPEGAAATAATFTFFVIAAGGIGAVVAGQRADRTDRESVTIGVLALSGGCALVIGWFITAPVWWVVVFALFWGFWIVADSAQFSALVTEVAPSHAVGTALTLQTMLGFALTGVSIQLATWMSEEFGWGPAFSVLALGPVAGIMAMARLKRVRAK